MITHILNAIEALVNKLVRLDPEVASQLAALSHKTLAIAVTGIDLTCYIQPCASGVTLRTTTENPVDVTVTGSVLGLLRLLTADQPQALLTQQQVMIVGNLETLQQFKAIMTSFDIDWEEQLSRIVGDVAAHQIGNFVRGFTGWGKQTVNSLQQNLTEYLHEEIRYFPPREELQDFMQDVDKLRDDSERLELRYQRLVNLLVSREQLT